MTRSVYIGSANLTFRSMNDNLEAGICTGNREIVSRAATYFRQAYQEAFDKRLVSET